MNPRTSAPAGPHRLRDAWEAVRAQPASARVARVAEARTSPGRLRWLGATLVVGALLTSVVSAFSAAGRQAALDEANGSVSVSNRASAELYSVLADAGATVTSGFAAPGGEPAQVRNRYDVDLLDASQWLVAAASALPPYDSARSLAASVSARIPRYAELVESARAYHRQSLPLAQTYLSSAAELLDNSLLPMVRELRAQRADRLAADLGRARQLPIPVLVIGLAALLGVLDASRREARRTNRVLNPGLVVSAGLLALALLWWLVAAGVARAELGSASRHAAAGVALEQVRSAVLQARSNESLVLIAHSGGASDSGFTRRLDRAFGSDGNGGLLAEAGTGADGSAGGQLPIDVVREQAAQWRRAHQRLRALDGGGNYSAAVASVTGADPGGSGAAFTRLGSALDSALADQSDALRGRVDAARSALGGLVTGPALLAVLAALGAAYGIGVRVREYR